MYQTVFYTRFCCHEGTASRAEEECVRILKIAGSPYEADSGDRWNTAATRAAGVLVINRYDWSHYDSRGKSDEEDNDDDGDFDPKIGLADYAAAGRGDHGVESAEGVILRCEGEYEFGRFAFDPEGDNGEAHAFLYFRTTTDFASTGFLGRPPLRNENNDDDDDDDDEWTP